MTTTMNTPALKMKAEIKLTSNGTDAKTAKVSLVARTGDAIDNPWFGCPFVNDFAGMSVKPRIPIDYAHDPDDSIGYLNKFDTSSGDLICSGAISLEGGYGDDNEDVAILVDKMISGVPYEASIEFGDDYTMEYVPEGMQVNVNDRDIAGPVVVIRQWTLRAVAICKFGMDDGTATTIQLGKVKSQNNKGTLYKVMKLNSGDTIMSKKLEQTVEAVKTPDVKITGNASDVVVEPVEVEEMKMSNVVAEVVETVEAPKPVEVEEDKDKAPVVSEGEATVALSKSTVETVDPRAEFKMFLSQFGDKAAEFYGKGMSLSDATKEYVTILKADNDKMKQRLTALRGAEEPVKFSDASSRENVKPGMAAVVKLAK